LRAKIRRPGGNLPPGTWLQKTILIVRRNYNTGRLSHPRCLMCLALRLGKSASAATGEDPANRRFESNAVTNGDVDWLDLGPRSNRGTDYLSGVLDRGPIANGVAERPGLANQNRFRAANRGDVEEQANVGGDANSAGMSDPVTVDDDEIGLRVEIETSLNNCRRFPEGEETRHVGKCRGLVGQPSFDDGQLGPLIDDHGGPS
jgi:hypothetical protein